jgi:hypothetical protein
LGDIIVGKSMEEYETKKPTHHAYPMSKLKSFCAGALSDGWCHRQNDGINHWDQTR